jgi:hypothetical protein
MFGRKRSFKMTRLREPAKPGDTTITVEKAGVDLVKGDRIALAATDYVFEAGEDVFVESYNAGSGVITLATPV